MAARVQRFDSETGNYVLIEVASGVCRKSVGWVPFATGCEARPGTRRTGAEGNEAAGDAMGQARDHRPREALAWRRGLTACFPARFSGGRACQFSEGRLR
jgi:hypothetical protein